MAQLTLPVGKQEFHDGINWYSLASENWVLNSIANVPACLVTTTSNLTATYNNGPSTTTPSVGATLTNSGTQATLSIDGVTVAVGNRVLVKDQTVGLQNGIYTVTNIGSASTNWILTRATDYDSASQMIRGNTVLVIGGTTNSVTSWMLISSVNSVGIDSITFSKLSQSSASSILGTANQVIVTVSGGVATIGLATNTIIPGTGCVTIPTGTTAQRPGTPTVGMIRLNTSL